MSATDVTGKTAFEQYLDGELEKPAPPAPPLAPAPEEPPAPRHLMTFKRIIPPVDTIDLAGEPHVLRPFPILPTGLQTAIINDRNAQLAIRQRLEAGEAVTPEELVLHDWYLERILRAAIPTAPDWVYLPVEQGGMLPSDREVLVNLFFVRSNEVVRIIAGQPDPRSISPTSSPGSTASSGAASRTGSTSRRSGSKSTPTAS